MKLSQIEYLTGFKLAGVMICVSLLLGCGSAQQVDTAENQNATSNESTMTVEENCTEPRPGVCTMIYAPVCAVDGEGNSKEYPSGCSACTNPSVVGFNPGSCAVEDKQ